MHQIKALPFCSQHLSESLIDCVLWQSDTNICEFNPAHVSDPTDTQGLCDPSGLYYGTFDSREPKFCARHFYLRMIAENETHLVDEPVADVSPSVRVQRNDLT